jgi:hypothetical protein
MIALIVSQCDGDGIFAFADKLAIVVAGLMGEDHSCALHRDAFAIPHHIDRVSWNAIELRKRALDGFSVDVGLIHLRAAITELMLCLGQIMRRGDSVPAVDAFYGSVARVQPCQ